MEAADGVYPSSEDTYLLIDALQSDADYIRQTIGSEPLCIEIGYVLPSLSGTSFTTNKEMFTDINIQPSHGRDSVLFLIDCPVVLAREK